MQLSLDVVRRDSRLWCMVMSEHAQDNAACAESAFGRIGENEDGEGLIEKKSTLRDASASALRRSCKRCNSS
jgi:hypothetical protein